MNIEEQIRIHQTAIENLERQAEMNTQIEHFNNMLSLKKSDPMGAGVQNWKISELETRLNEYKDLLHGFQKVYKELVSS